MSLTPMSREAMKLMIIVETESQIRGIVSAIYSNALNTAKTSHATAYYHLVPIMDPFYRANMQAILNRLETLFPDCTVSHTLVSRGTNGKLYDISKIQDDELHLANSVNNDSYIIIDWA